MLLCICLCRSNNAEVYILRSLLREGVWWKPLISFSACGQQHNSSGARKGTHQPPLLRIISFERRANGSLPTGAWFNPALGFWRNDDTTTRRHRAPRCQPENARRTHVVCAERGAGSSSSSRRSAACARKYAATTAAANVCVCVYVASSWAAVAACNRARAPRRSPEKHVQISRVLCCCVWRMCASYMCLCCAVFLRMCCTWRHVYMFRKVYRCHVVVEA